MINKKASMELGISTVVVLVIAMVIIAGGIAFIRGFFKMGEDKLGSAFNVGDFGVQPTSVEPLVLVEGSPSLKSGNTQGVKVGFYNKDVEKAVTIVFGKCVSTAPTSSLGCSGDLAPIISALPQTVKQGDSAGFETFVTAACTTAGSNSAKLPEGEYICQIKAIEDGTNVVLAETQVTITVTG